MAWECGVAFLQGPVGRSPTQPQRHLASDKTPSIAPRLGQGENHPRSSASFLLTSSSSASASVPFLALFSVPALTTSSSFRPTYSLFAATLALALLDSTDPTRPDASPTHVTDMPSFFQFTQGTESRVRPTDSSPLLGRFRAVPPRPGLQGRRRSSPLGLLAGRRNLDPRGSVHVGYGATVLATAALLDDDQTSDGDTDSEDEAGGLVAAQARSTGKRWARAWKRWFIDLWVHPRQAAVNRVVDKWWSRYAILVFLPAALVSPRGPP